MGLKNLIAIIAILAFSLILFGCSDKGATTTSTLSPQATLATTTTTTTISLISAEIKSLQDKAANIKSVKYTDSATKDVIYLKGTKAKRGLFVTRDLKIAKPYEVVYLDMSQKKAYAVCMSSLCKTEYKLKYWPINYNEFAISNDPMAIMNSVVSGTIDTMQTKRILNFPVTYMDFEDKAGKKGVMWVSMFYGVPLEYTINNVKTEYLYIAFNSLTDSDVNIPSGYTELAA